MDIQSIKQRFGVIGNAHALNRAIDIAVQVAPTDLSVLVTGESGVGKELIANALHNLSSRKDKALIKVHCAASILSCVIGIVVEQALDIL